MKAKCIRGKLDLGELIIGGCTILQETVMRIQLKICVL